MIYDSILKFNKFILFNEDESSKLAKQIALTLKEGDIILFEGDIGVGKSFFCRAIIQELFKDQIDVPSPTFTLVQTYQLQNFSIFHYDLYRLSDVSELDELSIEEAFDNVCLIEWPELIENIVPRPFRKICLDIGKDDSRICTITLESN